MSSFFSQKNIPFCVRRRFVDDDEEGFHENAPFSSERCEGGAPLKLKMAMRNENIRVFTFYKPRYEKS